MNNRNQFVCVSLLSLCTFVCGCRQKPAKSAAQALADESSRRSHEVLQKYRTGDYQIAKPALQDYLQFLDKASYPPNAPDMYRADAMITCVRLAKLEEKEGHSAEQAAYMKQAVAWCERGTLTAKCNDEALRKEVDCLDALPK